MVGTDNRSSSTASMLLSSLVFLACGGCDGVWRSEIRLAPPTVDTVVADGISAHDRAKALALFETIVDERGYSLQASDNRKGRLSCSARGPNFYGPNMTYRDEEHRVVITVEQICGAREFSDSKQLRKQFAKAFIEAFGQERVTVIKIQ